MDGMKRSMLSGFLVISLGILTGCQTTGLKAERDALWSQNVELQQDLTQARTALDSLEVHRNQFADEARDLRLALEGARGGGGQLAPEGVVAVNTGFDHIPGVETVARSGSIAVRVPGDILFNSGRVSLKSAAKRTLDQIALVIQHDYANNMIRIEGYTDKDPIRKSKWKDNLELSGQRAAAVHRYLQSRGIDPTRMYAAGFGQWHPRASKSKSRRVEIVVVLEE